MTQHYIIEIRTQGFRREADGLATGRAPSPGTFRGSLLTGTSVVLIGPIVIDQQRQRLDAREDWKLFDVAAAAGGPSRLEKRASVRNPRGGREHRLHAFAQDEAALNRLLRKPADAPHAY